MRKTKGKPTERDQEIGMRLRVARQQKGLSQEKLAEEIGLTFQQVQKYEKGMNRISATRLEEFSKILEIPIMWFYRTNDDAEKFMLLDPEVIKAVQVFNNLPANLQSVAISQMRQLAKVA